MFSAFLKTAFFKVEKITKQYKNFFIIFAGSSFLESCGRKICGARWRQSRDGRHSGSTLCPTVFLRCRCNVTVGDCKNSPMWNGEEYEILIDFVRNNECHK